MLKAVLVIGCTLLFIYLLLTTSGTATRQMYPAVQHQMEARMLNQMQYNISKTLTSRQPKYRPDYKR